MASLFWVSVPILVIWAKDRFFNAFPSYVSLGGRSSSQFVENREIFRGGWAM